MSSQNGEMRWYIASQIYARRMLQAWGRFVATHQIAVLLHCCVFLCALTYPVLSLYAWAAPSSTSDFFDFLRTSPTWNLIGADGSIARARDLKLPWQDLDALVVNSEEACWQRIPKFREVSVQQILLGFPEDGGTASEHGVLDRRALHSVHKLERKLQEALSSDRMRLAAPCVQLEDPNVPSYQRCLTLSPMAYWNNDESAMLADTSLIATVNLAEQRYYDMPLRQDVLFGGRVHSGSTMRKADYAVLTVFLQEAPSLHVLHELLQSLTADSTDIVLVETAKKDSKVVMKHRSDVRVRSKAWEDVFFYLGYVVVGLYIFMTLRGLDKVHSKMGLVLTGIVQSLASGMMSLSLCALAGYKINLVPWKLIPFLIIVLGVDNMFVLTSAVSSTSINLSVKERIAEGLSMSGVSIFLNLVAELFFIWGLYIFIPARVIREMVVFNAIALIMDFLLEMTYFITVLSIDMQRLELADFITQGSRTPTSKGSLRYLEGSKIPKLAEGLIRSFQERKARTYTAILLVASNWFLYILYGADYFVPAFCSNLDFAEGPKLSKTSGAFLTASEAFWQHLGARPSEAVHVHITTPFVFFFGHGSQPSSSLSNITRSSIRTAIKFVGLPISFTTLVLYLLLRQLLKGSEMLNTKESSQEQELEVLGPKDIPSPDDPSVNARIVSSRQSDIELLACSRDGRFTATWVPLEHAISVLPTDDSDSTGTKVVLPLKGVLARGENLIAVSLSDRGDYCAAASSSGRLLIWPLLLQGSPVANPSSSGPAASRILRISAEHCLDDQKPPKALGSLDTSQASVLFYTTHQDGSVMQWASDRAEPVIIVASAGETCRTTFLEEVSESVLIMRTIQSKSIQIWAKRNESAAALSCMSEITANSGITSEASCRFEGKLILALGFKNGTTAIYDVEDGGQLLTLNASTSPVKKLRLSPIAGSRCPSCTNYNNSGLSVAIASSAVALQLYKVTSSSIAACNCRPFSPAGESSSSKPASLSPLSQRRTTGGARRPSEDVQALSYPLSPHALRRFSHAASDRKKIEESTGRKAVSNGEIINGGSHEPADPIFAHTRNGPSTHSDASSPDEISSWSSQYLGSIQLDERGQWDTDGHVLVGMRRKSTFQGSSPFARWDVWTTSLERISFALDPSSSHARSLFELLQPPALDGLFRVTGSGGRASQEADLRAQLPFFEVRRLQMARASGNTSAATVVLGNSLVQFDITLPALSVKRTRSRQPLT